MTVVRWQPFREIQNIHRQFDSLFDELVSSNSKSNLNWIPAVELQDTDTNVVLRAQLPGIEGKDLDVQVTADLVVIAGERHQQTKEEKPGYFRSEFRYGKFKRAIPLPVRIQNDRVEANFKDGILTLTLPKVETAQRRVVKIDLGNTPALSDSEAAKDLEQAQAA
jgi:HSP20 family protein